MEESKVSNSTKKPYYHFVCFSPKTQRFFRNKSRRLIRRKGKRALKSCLTEQDLEGADYVYLVGTSFKDGYDEWTLPSDGHQVYLRLGRYRGGLSEEDLEEFRKRITRK